MQSSKESQSLYQGKIRKNLKQHLYQRPAENRNIPLENENPSRQNLKLNLRGGPVSAVLEPSPHQGGGIKKQ